MYDNFIRRGKVEEDKTACLFAYLLGVPRVSYWAKFILHWSLTEEGLDYKFVCKWHFDRYDKTASPDELISVAMNVLLDKEI